MADRIHVKMSVDLFVEDENAMHEAAYERMRKAWTSEDDFPFDSAADVPFGQVVHSVLADAIPVELPGCRRSQLEVEAETSGSEDEQSGSPGDQSDEPDDTEPKKSDSDDVSDDDETTSERPSGDSPSDQTAKDQSSSSDTSDGDDAGAEKGDNDGKGS